MEGAPVLEPIEHSVLEKPLDFGPMEGTFDLEPLEHSVSVIAPMESTDTFVRMAVSDPLEHAGPTGTDDVGQKLLPLEPFKHSVPEESQSQGDGWISDMDERVELGSVCIPRVSSDAQNVDIALLDDRLADRSWTEPGEVIVVGAVGSAGPWFLTGWAHVVEVDFMIDTGCQVTN